MATDVPELASKAIEKLGLSKEVTEKLGEIQSEIADAYRAAFVEMVQAMKQQASALDRIQTTLNILVQHLPIFVGPNRPLPTAFAVAAEGERADLAKAVVAADPIGAGYTLSQTDLARALGLAQADVSILVRAFGLPDDGQCAVVVRKGSGREIVNYHPRAVRRFQELVAHPGKSLPKRDQQKALERVRSRLIAPPG
jgi:hypothetical protein